MTLEDMIKSGIGSESAVGRAYWTDSENSVDDKNRIDELYTLIMKHWRQDKLKPLLRALACSVLNKDFGESNQLWHVDEGGMVRTKIVADGFAKQFILAHLNEV